MCSDFGSDHLSTMAALDLVLLRAVQFCPPMPLVRVACAARVYAAAASEDLSAYRAMARDSDLECTVCGTPIPENAGTDETLCHLCHNGQICSGCTFMTEPSNASSLRNERSLLSDAELAMLSRGSLRVCLQCAWHAQLSAHTRRAYWRYVAFHYAFEDASSTLPLRLWERRTSGPWVPSRRP